MACGTAVSSPWALRFLLRFFLLLQLTVTRYVVGLIRNIRSRLWYTVVHTVMDRAGVAMSGSDSEYLTMQEATRLLGIGRMTLWRRVRDGVLPVYRSERDRRARLVRRSDVERLLVPTIAAPAAIGVDGGKWGTSGN